MCWPVTIGVTWPCPLEGGTLNNGFIPVLLLDRRPLCPDRIGGRPARRSAPLRRARRHKAWRGCSSGRFGSADRDGVTEHDRIPARGDFLDEVAVMASKGVLAHVVELGSLLD